MSSEANEAVAKRAPTEQQESKPGVPKRFAPGQTVCNEKNEKGKLCNGHLKQLHTQHPSESFLRGDDVLYACQACGTLYMGPPMGHVRDPRKQRRYVESDLAAILRAAGGTLPVYDYPVPSWRGEPEPRAAVAARSAAKPSAATSAPEGETPEQKKARLLAEHKARLAAKSAPAASGEGATTVTDSSATTVTVADSSPSADAHRPAAEAQAATGQASAAPMSPTAATASPAAGAETVSDLAAEASTEKTPGAPRDERPKADQPTSKAADASGAASPAPKAKKGSGGFKIPPELQPKPGETLEEKIARLKRINEEAKRAAGKL
ncbi:MAG TPA: hypothetical protein VE713_19470 [Pyrinomonadaceae bacterium]|jgi:hypothetical protein|nr:hypothetical protein [Pyrinomonadaceae bacterium]